MKLQMLIVAQLDLKRLTLGNRSGATSGYFLIGVSHLDAVFKLASYSFSLCFVSDLFHAVYI